MDTSYLDERLDQLPLDQQVAELKELLRRKDAQILTSKASKDQMAKVLEDAQQKLEVLSRELARNEEELATANGKIEAMERETSFETERWKQRVATLQSQLETATKQIQSGMIRSTSRAGTTSPVPGTADTSKESQRAAEEYTAALERIRKLEAELREQQLFAERERQTLMAVIEQHTAVPASPAPSRAASAVASPIPVRASPAVRARQVQASPALAAAAVAASPMPPMAPSPSAQQDSASWPDAPFFQAQVAALQAELQEAQQQHHTELLAVKQRWEGRVNKLSEESISLAERLRAAEAERDEALGRVQQLQEEMVLQGQHSDREIGDLKQRIGELQQELSNVRVALLAATEDSTHRPDIGLVQRNHELEDQIDELRAQYTREKEQLNSEHRIEMARARGQTRRLMEEGKSADNKVKLLQAELQKQTDYFHEENGIMQHQLELLRNDNVKMKSEIRALTQQAQRDRADYTRNTTRLQRELEHSVSMATEQSRCRIRELEAELEALRGPAGVELEPHHPAMAAGLPATPKGR
ncbi:hypothetical protein PAPYR_4950 [Paratrimastix pyriformis]|uniref:Uncharacterized protein n=1 Tax=Paratrimastix pyriformis TaxID=342808 RepID=A0ABQ8UIV0_9EUKA|nr:hypothetical protein PAPYR_4950 [Paratrimastix pyriformis]